MLHRSTGLSLKQIRRRRFTAVLRQSRLCTTVDALIWIKAARVCGPRMVALICLNELRSELLNLMHKIDGSTFGTENP
jgi:hypothetical protein